ncbi:MAG: dUTP diphosphatase [Deltaproteobacteria bacterium]|nr:MAG: dUTP diphosphatase [Deltaproteobacteria bacterium]
MQVVLLPHGEGIELPQYQTALSAGCDVRAAVTEPYVLGPGERYPVPAGFRIAIPAGFEVQIRPRSGLALRHGVTVPNAPGTIDADYRGELKILLANYGSEPFVIERGARIAQMVIAPVVQATFAVVAELDDTERGHGGFGSTGVA